MSRIEQFVQYAGAFEKAFESDDWSVVEPFFADDAVYEVTLEPPLGGRFEGRDAILAYFKDILDRFDRRFERREIALVDGPTEDGDRVWLRGTATYHAPGVPAFVLELEETLHYAGDRIVRLEDRYTPEMRKQADDFIREHGPRLGIETQPGDYQTPGTSR